MNESVASLVLTILAILVIIIFLGSIYAFGQAIIGFIFSGGDSEKIKKAWNGIRYMILGIIMTIAFLFIFPLIFKRIQLPGYEVYTASNVFKQAGVLIRGLFLFGREAVVEYEAGTTQTVTPKPGSSPVPAPGGDGTLEL